MEFSQALQTAKEKALEMAQTGWFAAAYAVSILRPEIHHSRIADAIKAVGTVEMSAEDLAAAALDLLDEEDAQRIINQAIADQEFMGLMKERRQKK